MFSGANLFRLDNKKKKLQSILKLKKLSQWLLEHNYTIQLRFRQFP